MDTSKTGLPYFFVYLYLYLLFPFMLYFYFYVLLFFYNAGLWRKRRKLQWLIGSSMFVAASIAIHLLISCISTVKSHCFTNFQNPTRCKDSWIGFAVPASGIKRQGMKVRIQRSIPFTPLLTQLDLLVFTFCCHKKEMMEKKKKKISSSNRIKHRQSREQINPAIKQVYFHTPVLLLRSTWRRAFCVLEHKTTPHLSFLSALFHP